MANLPFGLRAIRKLDGSSGNFQTRSVFVPASDGNAIFLGDLVKYVTMVTTGNPNLLPTVAQYTTSTAQTAGVVVGINPVIGVTIGSENLNRVYRPASTAYQLDIIDDQQCVFEIMGADGTANGTNLLGNFEIYTSIAGSTVTGQSGMQLDIGSVATTATLPLRALAFSQRQGNTLTAVNTVFEVLLNTVANRNSTGLTL